MKTKKTKPVAAASQPKGKVKIKNLKVAKETIERVTDTDAAAVKGGLSKGGNNTTIYCWVARAVYGEDNPRWLLFRQWLMTDAPAWFRGLYLRHGERFALWLAPHAVLKSVIRLWMDSRIEQKSIALSQLA